MDIYIPFLTYDDGDSEVSKDMELASAFLYFELNKSEPKINLFSKQPKEYVSWISRVLYPLKAKLYNSSEKLYCVFDCLGSSGNTLEIKCSPEVKFNVDVDNINSTDIKDRTERVKNIVCDIKKSVVSKLESGHLIWGYKKIEDILKGKPDDLLREYSANLNGCKNITDGDTSYVKEIILKLEQSIEIDIQFLKDLCSVDEVNVKDMIMERNKTYEYFKDKILQTNKEVGSSLANLIIDRENTIREIEKIYSSKEASLNEEYIFNKNKLDIAEIYENEVEVGIYKRSMSEAENRIEQYKKECDEEIKKIERHYDSMIEGEKGKIKQAVDERDKKLKENDNIYNDFHNAINELKKAVSEDVFTRRSQLSDIRSWFGKFDCNQECESINISIPFYIAKYDGGETRYKLFMPGILKEKGQIMSLISGITGKVPLPFDERDAFFSKLFSDFKDTLKSEDNVSIINQMSAKNLIKREDIGERVESGLKALLNNGYLNDKNYEKVLSGIKSMLSKE